MLWKVLAVDDYITDQGFQFLETVQMTDTFPVKFIVLDNNESW